MAKPVIKFKTYRQASAVGGKIYGVPNLGDPVVAEVTMQEVIDYAKLHNYSADTLTALLSQVISGVADLVARDGRPRNLSDLLKFEPVIKGTFANMEQTVTDQKVLVRPRLLKEIRVKLNAGDYSWQNQNDTESPRLISAAPRSDDFSTVDLASFLASISANGFGWTYAGSRLCPNGFDANCGVEVIFRPRVSPVEGVTDFYLTRNPVGSAVAGYFEHDSSQPSTDNSLSLRFAHDTGDVAAWYNLNETVVGLNTITPVSGDELIFVFTRTTSLGDTFTVEKAYTL